MNAVLLGPDRTLADALQARGVEIRRVDGPATRQSLLEAGVADASLLVVTDVAEATAIPIAREANPDLDVVIYAAESMPEFVRGQVDLAVAPGVLAPEAIAEELVAAGAGA